LKRKEEKETNFAGGFAGSLTGGEEEGVVMLAAAEALFSLSEEGEAETLFEVEERLSFKSTLALLVSENPLFPVKEAFLMSVDSPSFALSGSPSRNSVSSKSIILYLSRSASIALVINQLIN